MYNERPGTEVSVYFVDSVSRDRYLRDRSVEGSDLPRLQPVGFGYGSHLHHRRKLRAHIFSLDSEIFVALSYSFSERERKKDVARNHNQKEKRYEKVFIQRDRGRYGYPYYHRNKTEHYSVEKPVHRFDVPEEFSLYLPRLHIFMVSYGQVLKFSYDRAF